MIAAKRESFRRRRGPRGAEPMTGKPRSILVLGGARSGKSGWARALAERGGRQPVLIATARAGDAEMAERIARHREERGPRWTVIEEPDDIAAAIAAATGPGSVVVVDCLTLWLSNLMLAGRDVEAATAGLPRVIAGARGPLVLVSNAVGEGVVPRTELGRKFRDAQGRLNQAAAAACDAVVVMHAGLPSRIKPAPAPDLEI